MPDKDLKPIWENTIKQLGQETSGDSNFWLSSLHYIKASENEIYVEASSAFVWEEIRKRFSKRIEKLLTELAGKNITVLERISTQGDEGGEASLSMPQEPLQSPSKIKKNPDRPVPQFQEDYVFETFVVSEANKYAYNAAQAVAKNPSAKKNYNPLLIYGGTGLGKTHLMQGIGQYIYKNSELKVLYITGEGFMQDFVEMVGRKKMDSEFKKKYRHVDILLIDDIHTIEKGAGTQEELFYTFEELYKKNKQMVFTCDRPISELKNMAPRLQSRFQWGLHMAIQPPDYETRVAILKNMAERYHYTVPDEVIYLISKNISSNVRDLEGALSRICEYGVLLGRSITLEIAQRELKDDLVSQRQGNLSVENIQRVTADYFHLSLNDLKGKKRSANVVRARRVAMYLVRDLTELSLTEIGQEFGGKDHATVHVSCNDIENEMRINNNLYGTVQELKRMVKEYGVKGG
jgi:chromosomal replication initiator protein